MEADLIECVILLPENLFYNTTAPAVIIVVNKAKRHAGEILLMNASNLLEKGRPKNYLRDEDIQRAHELYRDWRAEEGLSAVLAQAEAARNDYNLSPSRYVARNGADGALPLEEAIVLLRQAEEERNNADHHLAGILRQLGMDKG